MSAHTILIKYQLSISGVAPYQSGQFYQQEMPCLLALLTQIHDPLYATSIGIDNASIFVKTLCGKHRLPDIVSQVDRLSRQLTDKLLCQ